MGSYISIHNNTSDTYSVKVGVDEAALRVLGRVTLVLGFLALCVASAGFAAPFLKVAVVANVLKVTGIKTVHVVAFANIAAILGGVTFVADAASLGVSFAVFLTQELENDGYVTIRRGQQHKFGRYTLSLWRQGTCHRFRPIANTNPPQVIADTVYMRPIFSGSTNNSTRVHDIQHWINRWGHENHTVIELSVDEVDSSPAAMDAATAQCKDIDWIKAIEEASRKAMQGMLQKEGLDVPEGHEDEDA